MMDPSLTSCIKQHLSTSEREGFQDAPMQDSTTLLGAGCSLSGAQSSRAHLSSCLRCIDLRCVDSDTGLRKRAGKGRGESVGVPHDPRRSK